MTEPTRHRFTNRIIGKLSPEVQEHLPPRDWNVDPTDDEIERFEELQAQGYWADPEPWAEQHITEEGYDPAHLRREHERRARDMWRRRKGIVETGEAPTFRDKSFPKYPEGVRIGRALNRAPGPSVPDADTLPAHLQRTRYDPNRLPGDELLTAIRRHRAQEDQEYLDSLNDEDFDMIRLAGLDK